MSEPAEQPQMTQMNTDRKGTDPLTERIIGCAYKVGNTLGRGFLERVYENALAVEFRRVGLQFEQQKRLVVCYEGEIVGEYIADIVVESRVLLEIKAARGVDAAHEAQAINYLVATGLPIALLINFGARVDVRRFAGPALQQPHLCPSVKSVAGSSVLIPAPGATYGK